MSNPITREKIKEYKKTSIKKGGCRRGLKV
jgi:hypothetical protein